MDMKTRIAQLLADTLRKAWPQAGELPQAEELRPLLEVPPEPKLGDYAFPCFRFAKTLRMAPPKIAQALAEAFDAPETASVQAVNGYLNFFLNRVNFARDALESVLAAGEKYGATRQGEGKTICLDYSSINIAKRFHIGHLSTTMLGHSLKRIYEHPGLYHRGHQSPGRLGHPVRQDDLLPTSAGATRRPWNRAASTSWCACT